MKDISEIDLLYLTKIVMLSESEIKNILITYIVSDEGITDIYLVKRLENAASIIHSEQSIRLYDYIMKKADEQKTKSDMSED